MKVELLSAMSLLKFNGGTIARPPQTVLHSRDEEFVCSPTRAAAAGKIFIIFDIFQLDQKSLPGHLCYWWMNMCILEMPLT